MNNKGIVYITPYIDENGGNCKFSALGEYSASVVNLVKDHFPCIYILCQKGDFKEYQNENVIVIPLWERGTITGAFKMCAWLLKNKKKLSIAHVQHEVFAFSEKAFISVFYYFILLLILKFAKLPAVTTVHGVISFEYFTKNFTKENNVIFGSYFIKLIYAAHIKLTCYLSSTVVVHNNKIRRILKENYRLSVNKIKVIPIPLYSLNEDVHHESQLITQLKKEGKQVVLFFGHIAPYRGLDIAVQAIEMLSNALNNVVLLVSGTVPKRYRFDPTYETVIKSYSQKKAVILDLRFIPQPEIKSLIAQADILVLPYKQVLAASGPMAYAVKYGTPVACSAQFADVIDDVFIYGETPQELMQFLKTYFTTPSTQQKLRTGILDYQNEWASSKIATLYQNLYQQALI
jgi:glycosyltransferase involved in cell wall biosynthesis